MKIQEKSQLKSKDQIIAILLYAAGMNFVSYEWVGSVCYFVFEDEAKCNEMIQMHLAGKLSLPSKTLLDAYRTIKDILRS